MRLLSFACVSLAACGVELARNLDQPEADGVLRTLERAGIAADKAHDAGARGAFSVRVAREDVAAAVEALRAQAAPRTHDRGFAEVYGAPSLVPTPTEERARLMDAVAGEVARTLRAIDGVIDARVHVALDDGVAPSAPRASVLLATTPGRVPLAEQDVRRVVAGAVPGLAEDAVAVVLAPRTRADARAAAPAAPRRRPRGVATGLAAAVALLGGALVAASLRNLALRRKVARLSRPPVLRGSS